MIIGNFSRPLSKDDVWQWCVFDENVNQLLNRDREMLFIVLLINKRFSKTLLSANFTKFKFESRWKVSRFLDLKIVKLNASYLLIFWSEITRVFSNSDSNESRFYENTLN